MVSDPHQLVVGEEHVITIPQAGDDIAYVSHNGGEHQHGDEQVGNHEQVLLLALGLRCVAHRGEDQRREPEAVKVLAAHGGKARVRHVGVHPLIFPEAYVSGEGEVHTGVPVD